MKLNNSVQTHVVESKIRLVKDFNSDLAKLKNDILTYIEIKTLEETLNHIKNINLLNIMLEDSVKSTRAILEKHISNGNYAHFTIMSKMQMYIRNFDEYIDHKLKLYKQSLALLPKDISERLIEVKMENEDEVDRLAYYYLLIFAE